MDQDVANFVIGAGVDQLHLLTADRQHRARPVDDLVGQRPGRVVVVGQQPRRLLMRDPPGAGELGDGAHVVQVRVGVNEVGHPLVGDRGDRGLQLAVQGGRRVNQHHPLAGDYERCLHEPGDDHVSPLTCALQPVPSRALL